LENNLQSLQDKLDEKDNQLVAMQRKFDGLNKEKVVHITLPVSGPAQITMDGPWTKLDLNRIQRPMLQAIRQNSIGISKEKQQEAVKNRKFCSECKTMELDPLDPNAMCPECRGAELVKP